MDGLTVLIAASFAVYVATIVASGYQQQFGAAAVAIVLLSGPLWWGLGGGWLALAVLIFVALAGWALGRRARERHRRVEWVSALAFVLAVPLWFLLGGGARSLIVLMAAAWVVPDLARGYRFRRPPTVRE